MWKRNSERKNEKKIIKKMMEKYVYIIKKIRKKKDVFL